MLSFLSFQSRNFPPAVAFGDIIKAWYAIDVDDVLGRNEPEFHRRYETLPAGEQFGIRAKFLKSAIASSSVWDRSTKSSEVSSGVPPSYIRFDFRAYNLSFDVNGR